MGRSVPSSRSSYFWITCVCAIISLNWLKHVYKIKINGFLWKSTRDTSCCTSPGFLRLAFVVAALRFSLKSTKKGGDMVDHEIIHTENAH